MKCEHSGAEWADTITVNIDKLKADIAAYRQSAAIFREKYEAAEAENVILKRRVISLEAQIQNSNSGVTLCNS